MNQTQAPLSPIWHHFQSVLFPWLEEEVGELSAKQQQFVEVLEFAQVERYLPECNGAVGRPLKSRSAMAWAFVAKAIYNLPTTEMLLDRLHCDIKLRRLSGWEKAKAVPSRSTFSRAFTEFSQSQLPERVHAGIIADHMEERLVGHISRDSTAIVCREKPVSKAANKAVSTEEAGTAKERGRTGENADPPTKTDRWLKY